MASIVNALLQPVREFLHCETPLAWVEQVHRDNHFAILIIDHLMCELKAAQSAAHLLRKYAVDADSAKNLQLWLHPFEQFYHFYQVLAIIEQYPIPLQTVSPSRYAKRLLQHCRTFEPATLIDKLIVSAYIEARSCERFAVLIDVVDQPLADFYTSLLRSESRHFRHYIALAQNFSKSNIAERIQYFGTIEAELISTVDNEFRFHSGYPC